MAVLGGFADASIMEPGKTNNSGGSRGDDLIQYGRLLKTILQQCSRCHEQEKVSKVVKDTEDGVKVDSIVLSNI